MLNTINSQQTNKQKKKKKQVTYYFNNKRLVNLIFVKFINKKIYSL